MKPHLGYHVMYDASASAAGQNWRVPVLRAFVSDPDNARITTLQYFPIGDLPQACTAFYDTPFVPPTSNGSTADQAINVIHAVDGLADTGVRALGPAYAGAITYMKQLADSQGMTGIVVLVVTGAPEDCAPKAISDLAKNAAQALVSEPMVRTAILGPPDLPADFDDVARAGGTPRAFRVDSTDATTDTAASTDFLLSLVGGSCEFDLRDSITGGTRDPALLVLSSAGTDGIATSIPQVGAASDCAGNEGWYVDETVQMARLCAKSCSENTRNTVTATYGCRGRGATK